MMPTYESGDYVKVEFQDETTGIGEWMWVRVHHCDDEKQLVFGTLDNEPVNLKEKLAAYNELDVAWFVSVKCTCAAKAGVIGHAAFCPLRDGTGPEAGC
jgi:hypothetical protein